MKKIVLACGAGAATSTLVAQKVATLLDANGYADKYEIVQCAISEAKDYCDEGADLLIATTVAPEGLTCPYVSGVPVIETPVSYFNDSLVEIMKQNGRGTKGHIGFAVNDIDAAEKWFAERGLEVNEESRALLPDGGTKLVYFKREFAGFAVHLCRE